MTATGQVYRGPDSIPVPGVHVVLHRVGRQAEGAIDSVTTAPDGGFRFRFRLDTSAVFIASARWQGIEYFSQPLQLDARRREIRLAILVADTSSTAAITVQARHLVIPRPSQDGTRRVLEVLVLRNPGGYTRVSPPGDGSRPSWVGLLPRGTVGLGPGESDFSPEAVTRAGDSVLVFAPIAPGLKQLTYEYRVPQRLGNLVVPFRDSTATVNVLIEEEGAEVSGPGLRALEPQVIEGRRFRRWTGEVPAGTELRIQLPAPRATSRLVLATLVSLLALALVLGMWRAIVRPAPAGAPPGADLLDAVAELDARYQGREREVAPEEWTRYQSERARLKAQLEAALWGDTGRS